jgi:hypothetical protein
MKKIRILGDIHDMAEPLVSALQSTELDVLQLGDFGGWDLGNWLSQNRDSYNTVKRLRVVLGNHENFDYMFKQPETLGDYGLLPNFKSSWFMRGAFSVDKEIRVRENIEWDAREELSYAKASEAVEDYQRIKPNYVFTHSPPERIKNLVLSQWTSEPSTSSLTEQALQTMFEFHKPQVWYFGHMHTFWTKTVSGTKFICIPSNHWIDVEIE